MSADFGFSPALAKITFANFAFSCVLAKLSPVIMIVFLDNNSGTKELYDVYEIINTGGYLIASSYCFKAIRLISKQSSSAIMVNKYIYCNLFHEIMSNSQLGLLG